MKKDNLKNNTMIENEIQRIYNFSIHPGDSNLYSDKGFVIIDKRSQGGTHWTCFIKKR